MSKLTLWYNEIDTAEQRVLPEEKLAKVEGILEEIRTRQNHLETEISQLRQDMNANNRELRQELNVLRERMDSHFRWTLGIMLGILIPMWVTIILTIL